VRPDGVAVHQADQVDRSSGDDVREVGLEQTKVAAAVQPSGGGRRVDRAFDTDLDRIPLFPLLGALSGPRLLKGLVDLARPQHELTCRCQNPGALWDLHVFVDGSTESITSNWSWCRWYRAGGVVGVDVLAEGSVWSVGLEVVFVFGEDSASMSGVEDEHAVEEFLGENC
jgi:hypothetical protein